MEQGKYRSPTTDSEIDAALIEARRYEEQHGPDPYATEVGYLEGAHILIVRLNTGLRLAIPVENLQGLEAATAAQLSKVEMMGIGYAFFFPDLDADFYVPALIQGIYGNKHWMARLSRRGLSAAPNQTAA